MSLSQVKSQLIVGACLIVRSHILATTHIILYSTGQIALICDRFFIFPTCWRFCHRHS
ncbi:hypothetical protein [Crinalium epipsammum]|uniref:hypothetical protein n=1 Tax=Crinalium epipsammum TaxID=241425 RepID=UPI0012FC3470|nr:hypothetical protein [Crinalium epipsammum]